MSSCASEPRCGHPESNSGLNVGTVTANAALVVGTQFVTSPPLSWDELTNLHGFVANTIKTTAMQVGQEHSPFRGHPLVRTTAGRLRGVMLEHAKKTAAEGRKLAGATGHQLAQRAQESGFLFGDLF